MKRILIFLFCLAFPLFSAAEERVAIAPNLTDKDRNPNKIFPVTVEYPHQNTRITEGSTGIFLFGKVNPNGGLLTINGTRVPIFRTGTYLAYLPVQPGVFDFILEFTDSNTTHKVKRTVQVLGFNYMDFEGKYKFDTRYIFPASDLEISTSDILDFTVAGSPGRKVKLSLDGEFKDVEMQESPKEPGIYKKTLSFSKDAPIKKPTRITYMMYDEKGKEKASATSKGKVKISLPEETLLSARVKVEDVRLRPSPFPKGHILNTKLFGKVSITGKINNLYRVLLDDGNVGWVERNFLTPATFSDMPKNIAWEISSVSNKEKTVIVIKNTEKVSFKIDDKPESFDVTLFYTQALNTIMSDVESDLIKSIDYEILSDYTKKVSAVFKPSQVLWGYNYRYEGNNLIFELYHKPNLFFTKKLPLKDLKIVIDPGHSPKRSIPYDGAVGPSGLLEYEANYKIAQSAKEYLESKGATVYMSKDEREQMGLRDRTKKVEELGAHLFISIHNNALPDHIDPFARDRGFSIFYYYPHSVPFARAMERSFIKNIGIPSEGVLEADFSVTRNLPQVPSILIENTYMMIPYQEELLRQDRFINMLGNAISEGVINYINPAAAEQIKPTIAPESKD